VNRRVAGSCLIFGALIVACAKLWFQDDLSRPTPHRDQVAEHEPRAKAPRRATALRLKVSLISGHVRDEAGAPVALANICVQTLERTTWSATRRPVCTSASETGAYQLASEATPLLHVTASAAGYEPGAHAVPLRSGETHEHVDLVLRAGGARLAGEVVDALGGAVAGANVRVEHDADGMNAGMVDADDTGQFALSVPAKTRLRVIATAEGYAPAQVVWNAPATAVRLVLSPASSLSGSVVLAQSGEPVSGVTVRAHQKGQLTEHEDLLGVSDHGGNFTISGVYAGRYELSVRTGRFRSHPARAVDVGLAKHLRHLLVEVEPAVSVRGDAVVAKTGQPCSSGSVVLFDAVPPSSSPPIRLPREGAYLRSDGSFELTGVLPGRYHAQADCSEHLAVDKALELTVVHDDVDGLRFRFEAGKRVRIEAKNHAGDPIAGAWVVVKRVPRDRATRPGWSGLTNSEGWLQIGGLDAGSYEASAVRLPSTPRQSFELRDADNETTVVLTSGGDAYIFVQVYGDPGAFDNRLEVHALPQQDPGRRSFRAPINGEPVGDGRFELGPLSAGDYEVFVSDPDNPSVQVGGPEGMMISVASGEKVALETRLRSRSGVIRGRVVDAAGAPVRDAWVSARFAGRRPVPLLPDVRHIQGETRILTDAEGRFEIGGREQDVDFTVKVERPDDSAEVTREGVRAGEEVTIELLGTAQAQATANDG
jgi:hypothetical protein